MSLLQSHPLVATTPAELDPMLASCKTTAINSQTFSFSFYRAKPVNHKKAIEFYRVGNFYTKSLEHAKELNFEYEVKTAIPMFSQRQWHCDKNKNLLEKIKSRQLNMTASTLHLLDKYGFSYLEILSLNNLIGKRIDMLPAADIDNLNLLQDKYQVVFNFDDKMDGKTYINLSDVTGGFANPATHSRPSFVFILQRLW